MLPDLLCVQRLKRETSFELTVFFGKDMYINERAQLGRFSSVRVCGGTVSFLKVTKGRSSKTNF